MSSFEHLLYCNDNFLFDLSYLNTVCIRDSKSCIFLRVGVQGWRSPRYDKLHIQVFLNAWALCFGPSKLLRSGLSLIWSNSRNKYKIINKLNYIWTLACPSTSWIHYIDFFISNLHLYMNHIYLYIYDLRYKIM